MVSAKDPNPIGVLRSQPVHVSLELLRQAKPGHRIRIQMFHDAVFEAKLTDLEVEPHVAQTFHWRGELVGRPGSTFVLTVHEDSFAGWIFPNDAKYQSLCIQGAPGMYVARELDDFKHQGAVVEVKASVGISQAGCNDDKNRIDILYVYDNTASAAAGGDSKARSGILNAHAQANTCMSRSSIATRYVAKTVNKLSYSASRNNTVDLQRLQNTGDGHMDEVYRWRQGWNADLVALVSGGSGGIAYCKSSWIWGFSVTGYSSLGAMTLAHELGHNMGCGHDPANGSCNYKSYGFGHNFQYDETGFPIYSRKYAYTVMSYASGWGSCSFPWSCSKTRQPNYSSPLVKLSYNSKLFATGTTTRDNRRTILDASQDVANHSVFVNGRHRAPIVTAHPQARNLAFGYLASGTVVMSCAGKGYGNTLSYQWRKNGRNLPGKTSANLTLSTNITASDAGRYDCVISTCAGSATTKGTSQTVGPKRVLRVAHNGSQYVTNLGDVDGDRFDDFAIGRNDISASRSEVIVFSGQTHRQLSYAWFTDSRRAGQTIAGADIDGDRYRDLIFGAPTYATNRGIVLWWAGADIRRNIRRIQTVKVGAAGEYLGGSQVRRGRFDGAANDDLLVGGNNTLYAISSRSGFPQLWKVTISGRGDFVTIGDVNGDGYDDVAVGIPSRRAVEFRSGRDGSVLRSLVHSTALPNAGFALAGPGDLNGDSVPDVVVSSPSVNGSRGWVRAISGATGLKLSEHFGTTTNNRLGWILSTGGDINRDGVNDILVSELPVSRSVRASVIALNGKNINQMIGRYSTGSGRYGWDTALIDGNGDGRADLLVSDYGVGVWLYDSVPKANPPAFQIYGRAGPGTGGAIPRISHGLPLARLGGTHDIRLHGARPNSAAICRLAAGRINIPLDAIGITGGSLLVDPILVDWVVATDSRGRARFTLPSLNGPYLNLKLMWQWIVLDPGGNSFGVTLSDAGQTTIGAR